VIPIFSPQSIAVVGASANLDRISGLPVRYLQQHEYRGEIYPVNPNHDRVGGLPCYPHISETPEVPDFAMVILPARLVVDTVKECLEAGVDTVLIVSSGFSETGEAEDAAAEQRLAELADEYDANIIGPNSQGIINIPDGIAASFTPALKRSKMLEGDVSFVTQSGAFGGALTTMFQDSGLGLDKWVATGNEVHLESLDFIDMLSDEQGTDVVAGYIEGFKDGRKLIELKRTTGGIDLPIVLLKVGRSDRGKTAAKSHTGTVAGSHRVYEGIFAETGVMVVNDVDRFLDVVRTVSTLEELPGPRIGVITTSGGAGVHIADVAEEKGLELPELTGETYDRISDQIPEYGSAINPVDMTAQVVNSPEAFRECLNLLLDDTDIDTVILQITNASGKRAKKYAETVVDIATESDTPLFVTWTGGVEKIGATEIYQDANVPIFENPAACVRTIATINDFRESKSRLRDASDLPARTPVASTAGPEIVTETKAKELLSEYGVPIPEERLVTSRDAAVDAASSIGYPVVAKLVSPDIQHRNRVGAIRTELMSDSKVESAFTDIVEIAADNNAEVEGVTIQRQVNSKVELSLGIVTDEDFGPVVMFGRGGVDIESVDDVTFRTIPTARSQAADMLDDLETVDRNTFDPEQQEALTDAIVGLSDLYMDNPWIHEADVNPIVVGSDGVVAVDGLFVGSD